MNGTYIAIKELSMAYSIKHWPQNLRPRERLLKNGAESLTNAELLGILLRNGGSYKIDAIQLARNLISNTKSLANLSQSKSSQLLKIKGMGPAKVCCVKAAFELAQRLEEEKYTPGFSFCSSLQVYRRFHLRFKGMKKEQVYLLLLDNKNRLIKEVLLAEGGYNYCHASIREIFALVLEESAVGMIIVHNHPSGDSSPSYQDDSFTQQLKKAAEIFSSRFLDHIIVGNDCYISYRDSERL